MLKTRILISDNYKEFVQLLVEFFSKQPDIEVVGVAYDGNQALNMVEQIKPDILLLDIIMPEMDGLEVLRKINEKSMSLRVFVISALGHSEEISKKAIEFGAEQCFIKPVNLNEILYIIRKGVS